MKNKKNPIGLSDEPERTKAVDELIKIFKARGEKEYQEFLKSDLFKLATKNDPRYHPELKVEEDIVKN